MRATTRRRPSPRVAFAVAATAVALVALPAAAAALNAGGDGVWVSGRVHQLLTAPGPANPMHVTPLYVIAPVSRTRPLHALADAKTHGFGAHDHVIQLPATANSFTGACDLTLVVPGAKASKQSIRTRLTATPAGAHRLLYAARLGGQLTPLTSASRIRQAQRLGLAETLDTHTILTCTVSAA